MGVSILPGATAFTRIPYSAVFPGQDLRQPDDPRLGDDVVASRDERTGLGRLGRKVDDGASRRV